MRLLDRQDLSVFMRHIISEMLCKKPDNEPSQYHWKRLVLVIEHLRSVVGFAIGFAIFSKTQQNTKYFGQCGNILVYESQNRLVWSGIGH